MEEDEIQAQIAQKKYARSFVDWSQSEFGFYVFRRPDPTHKRKWIYGDRPIVWAPHQQKIFRYALTCDRYGKLPFSEFWYLDVGQSGKSLFQAAAAMWAGMFHEQEAEVQIASNSKDQSKMRVYLALKRALERHPYSRFIADTGEGLIKFHKTNNIVRPMPLKASTQAGGTPVFRGFDEIWDYEGDEANTFFDEIKESPASDFSLMVVTSYPGYDDAKGPLNRTLDNYFEADDTPKDGLEMPFSDLPFYVDKVNRICIWWNHDALRYPWHSQEFMDRKRRAPGTTDAGFRRIWQAFRVSREDTFMPMDRWDDCEDETLEPVGAHSPKLNMVIAIDLMGGKLHSDCAAAIARGYDPITLKYPLLAHKIWNPKIIRQADFDYNEAVEQWVLDLHRKHNVLAVYYDPYQMVASAKRLQKEHVRMIECTQNTMRITADTHYRSLIRDRQLRNYPGCDDLRAHVEKAVARELSGGAIRMDKRQAAHRIDGAVADSMCCYGVMENKRTFERLAKKQPVVEAPRRRNVWNETFRMRTNG